jgi:hypothetical protein
MMKSFLIAFRYFALVPVLSFLLPAFLTAQNTGYIADWLESYRLSGDFQTISLLDIAQHQTDLRQVADHTTQLTLNQPALNQLLSTAPATLTFYIPNAYGETFALELVKTNILAPGFSLGTLGDHPQENVPVEAGIHYRGILKGARNSIATLSVYSTGVVAMAANENGTWQLAQLEDGSGHYVFYRTADLKIPSPNQCFTDDTAGSAGGAAGATDRGVGCKTVQVYFECDYQLYQDKGSNTTTVNTYVTSFFNQVAALYANENVGISISQIYVWTSADPYLAYNNTANILNAFRSNRGTTFNGNLAHFLSTRSLGGGIGYVDVICLKQYAFGVSAITTSFATVPTYSWTVEVVTHELGHNLGSWHTHSCNWPTGALDNCYTPEGSCSPGPAPVNGGTIMSYCHLTSYGINFNNGFGTVPGNLIRSKVLASTCTPQSGTAPSGLTASNITANAATVGWGAVVGATSYNVQYKLSSATTWTDMGTTTATSMTINGLTASTLYNWQVKTDCSSFSGQGSFTTTASGGTGGGGSTCTAPVSLSTTNITTTTAILSWAAVAGASGYTVQYKVATASFWNTAGTSSTSAYNLSGLTASTNYNWRVKANCSDYGGIASFTTAAESGGGSGGTCNAPLSLTNNSITATTAVISWGAVAGATSYTLQIKLANSTTFYTLGTVSVTKVGLNGLQPSTGYHWRVKANCSFYSNPILLNTPANFDAPPTGEMPVLQVEGGSLTLFPNPVSDLLNLRYSGSVSDDTRVSVIDATGRIRAILPLSSADYQLDVTEMPAGVYALIVWEGDRQVVTQRFVKIK